MRLRKIIFPAGVIGLLVAALAAAGPVTAQDGGDPENGAALYASNCMVCHGPNGEGRIGATLDQVFATIDTDTFLTEAISRGVEGSMMPAWSTNFGGPLTPDEIQDIVAYIESWGTAIEPPVPAPGPPPQDIPPVPQVDGDPEAGYIVFAQNCVACHGPKGEGRIGATLDRPFAAISPDAFIVQTVSRGVEGSLMPPFAQANGGPLTEQQINDVAAYVFSIQQTAPPAPSGEQVGRRSGLPLLFILLGSLVVIVALGLSVGRRESETPGPADHEDDDH
jgi:mono/diheme cytochrome c family protein